MAEAEEGKKESILMIEFVSAGESHGLGYTGIISGMPAGLKIDVGFVENELKLRRTSSGRSDRQKIEKDDFRIIAGLSGGMTTGAPISFILRNNDNRPDCDDGDLIPRPGHADYTGALKYGLHPMVAAERASARSTAISVAAGAIIRCLLKELGVICTGHVIRIGGVEVLPKSDPTMYNSVVDACPTRCADISFAPLLEAEINRVKELGDSVGGKVRTDIIGLPLGFGSYVLPSERLDAAIARSLMAIPAVKAVEIGLGAGFADKQGSQVSDPILIKDGKIIRGSNNCGGIEGGISNGNIISATATIKPVPTIKIPIASVNIENKEEAFPVYKRSDICAVPAAAIIARNTVALTVAEIISKELGGSTLTQVKRRFAEYADL